MAERSCWVILATSGLRVSTTRRSSSNCGLSCSARPIGGSGHARLQARYLFWGEEEKRAYPSSSQPWRDQAAVVGSGTWGTIYDLESAPSGR